MLGSVWALVHPLFLVVLLTMVFNFLLGARFGGTRELPLDYTVFILSGLVPWQACAMALVRGSVEIVGNASLVKQVVFPLAVLPVKGALTPLVPLAVGLIFLTAYVLVRTHSLPWTYALLPLLVLLQALLMMGLSLAFSALGVFFRDLKDLIAIFVTAGLYILPVIFVPTAIPKALGPVIVVNPFSYLVWVYQDVLYFGRIDHPWAWLVFATGALASFYLGFAMFRKLQPFFGNTL